jgi:hypothetical protein
MDYLPKYRDFCFAVFSSSRRGADSADSQEDFEIGDDI